jgi:hypothetical protein
MGSTNPTSKGQYGMIHKIHLRNTIYQGICIDNLLINAINRQLMINAKSIFKDSVYNLI